MKRRVSVCESERGSEQQGAGHTDLCKFAFGLLEIRMVFYIRLNFRILSNALQFGCIGNCCCLGLGYVSAKKQKRKQMRRGERARRWVRGKVQVAVGLFFDTAHFHAACCMWHVVAYCCCCCCCCPKLDFATVAAPPTLRCPGGQQHIICHSSWNA